MQSVSLFKVSLDSPRNLSNIFVLTPHQLDTATVHDLLNFGTIGQDSISDSTYFQLSLQNENDYEN